MKFSAFDPTTQYSRERTPMDPKNSSGLLGSHAIDAAASYGGSDQNQRLMNVTLGTPDASVW